MTLGDEFSAHAHKSLRDSLARGAGVFSYTLAHEYEQVLLSGLTEAVGNCIPGNRSVVEESLVLDVQQ